jgi:hypothetical protein
MKKISTLFKKDPNDLGRVINEIDPQNEWVFEPGVMPTRKYDGSACAIINGELYKRYDVKKGKAVPEGAIPCQDPDGVTGHWPHWLKCDRNKPEDQWFFEGFDDREGFAEDGTYELCGPKIQGNTESFSGNVLVKHGQHILHGLLYPMTFENLRNYLEFVNIEGIVFHHPDGRMCKLRKSDFGLKR